MIEPLPKDSLGQRICELFTYRWKWLEKPTDREKDTDWTTNAKYPLRSRVLWKKYQDAASIIGLRFGSSTKYALIDIDKGSPYLGLIDNIREALETIGIVRTIAIRSSWSGGIHIYCPLPAEHPTFSVACVFKQALEAQGFAIAPGELEVFPNTKVYSKSWAGEKFVEYNGHRLPLQPGTGSCLLDDQLEPMITDGALSRFFALWTNAQQLQDADMFEAAMTAARNNRRRRPQRAKGPVAAWREDLEQTIAEGWTGPGQTNALLGAIACYGRVFEGLGGEPLAEYIERIGTSRAGYSTWCRHQGEIKRRCILWARSAQAFYWPLGSLPLRDRSRANVNAMKAEEARDRIAEAAAAIKEQFTGSIRQLVARLCQAAQCSAATLYRNLQLWHPNYMPVTPAVEGPEPPTPPAGFGLTSMAQTLAEWGVTGKGGNNEVWNGEIPLKNIFLRGGGEGVWGRGGFSTGAQHD